MIFCWLFFLCRCLLKTELENYSPEGVYGTYNPVVRLNGCLGCVCEVNHKGIFNGVAELEDDGDDTYLLSLLVIYFSNKAT